MKSDTKTGGRKRLAPGFGRISATAMAYSLAVVCSAVMNLGGDHGSVSAEYLLELLALVVVIEIIDWLSAKLISNAAVFFIVDYVLISAAATGFLLLRGWISCDAPSILASAGCILLVFIAVYAVFVCRNRRDAKAINEKVAAASGSAEGPKD